MYPNENSFLTYWFLRIKWLFIKYVKITKEKAIHRNRFLQSFKKNSVYSLVAEKHFKKIYWVVSFQENVKKDSTEILEGQPQKCIEWTQPFFLLNPFISVLFCVKFHGERGLCSYFKYFENHKSCVLEFLHCQCSKVSDSYFGCKVFCLLQQILPLKRLFQKMDCMEKLNLSPSLTPVLTFLLFSRN